MSCNSVKRMAADALDKLSLTAGRGWCSSLKVRCGTDRSSIIIIIKKN